MPILALYGSALALAPAKSAWRGAGSLARAGAVLTILLLVTAWVRDIAFVDADRIKALLNHF